MFAISPELLTDFVVCSIVKITLISEDIPIKHLKSKGKYILFEMYSIIFELGFYF